MQYSLVGSEDGSNITVFVKGKAPLVAHSSHPNFDRIVEGARAADESVIDLFDVANAAATKFDKLSERVSVANGRLYLDGEEFHNALSEQVVAFVKAGVEDWKPLVAFYENVLANENDHSREQLYGWLSAEDFTITSDGLIVGYKSVNKTDDGNFLSINSGTATVDGEVQNGRIRQAVGSVVEMPRGDVQHDPAVGCHVGLHVGTWGYASGFSGDTVLEVHVNPRDVVSVPTDCGESKMRVCRYKVVGVVLEKKYDVPLKDYEWDEEDLDFEGAELLDQDNPVSVEEVVPVEGYGTVAVGDVFEDKDKRRKDRKVTVQKIDGNFAYVSEKRKIRLDRLTSRKYKKVS